MLEQAKACLKSGARESLRCAQAPPSRSKRLLHSTFWNHGAGDLGLPSGTMGASTLPHDNTAVYERVTARPAPKSKKEAIVWSTPTEGLFLDFLYPQHVLAHASRTRGQQCERWERRNARRLPEGFIHASRGYASRRYSAARAEAVSEDGRPFTAPSSIAVSAKADSVVSEVHSGLLEDGIDQQSTGDAAQDSAGMAFASDSFGFADSPTQLENVNTSYGGVQRLLDIISGSSTRRRRGISGQGQNMLEAAWSIYESLSSKDKDDVRLKEELLHWLCTLEDDKGLARCAELYHTIPIEQRTARVYLSALSAYLKRDMIVQAIKLHKEALIKIDNAEQITTAFFGYAVTQSRWQLAMYIESHYRTALEKKTGSDRSPMFWYQVSQIPRLLPRALLLSRYLRNLLAAQTSNEQSRRFCIKFFRAALVQDFQHGAPGQEKRSFGKRGVPKASVRLLFGYIQRFGESDPAFFEDMIMAMVQDNGRYDYTDVHEIVSRIYWLLRDTKHRLSERVFSALLDRLTQYFQGLQKHRRTLHDLSLGRLTADWIDTYGRIRRDAVARLLSFYSRLGHSVEFGKWADYLKNTYPRYDDQVDTLWTSIYLHARRAELPEAQLAFDSIRRLADANGQVPPLKCWNVLLHAQYRSDDLKGAMDTLQAIIDAGLIPDEYSFHPVMGMLAARGDVGGVEDLMSQYDRIAQKKREVALTACLLIAHGNCGEVDKAEDLLRATIGQVKAGEIRGSLTGPFNILLTEYALRRDVDATMRVYRWMKQEGARTDPDTYAALISALTIYRQTDAAREILVTVMKEKNVHPTAFHYALVMTGYIEEKTYDKAMDVYDLMVRRNVRQTLSSRAAYLQLKALQADRRSQQDSNQQSRVEALANVTIDLNNFLRRSQGADVSTKQPQIALNNPSQARDRYFSFLIQLHGKRKCLDAARALFDRSRERTGSSDAEPIEPSMNLLANFMSALARAQQWDEVEQLWLLAKEQADRLAAPVRVPQLRTAENANGEEPEESVDVHPMLPAETQEVGFQAHSHEAVKPADAASPPATRQTLLQDRNSGPTPSRPVPGRAHILTRPLRSYMIALAAQSRLPDLLRVVSQLYAQGYVMNNFTWNMFLQKLCESKPPLTLLAFSLTERFLIPQFPGWAPVPARRGYIPNRAARAEGLEYIRARYLRPDQLVPQYETMVKLAHALLTLRRLAATGRAGFMSSEDTKALGKYVGTAAQVRKQAPRTLFAVQSMPTVDDALQRNILRR